MHNCDLIIVNYIYAGLFAFADNPFLCSARNNNLRRNECGIGVLRLDQRETVFFCGTAIVKW